MATKAKFLQRVNLMSRFPVELRNQILDRELYTELEDYFQVADCERVLREALKPRQPHTTVYQQTVQEPVPYQQYPQAYYPTQPYPVQRKKKKSDHTNGALTTVLIIALLVVVGFIFFNSSGFNTQDFLGNLNLVGANQSNASAKSCGGDMPNTYLQFGMWRGSDGVDYFVPTNTPSLHEETSALCFDVAEMHRFYSQTSIAINSKTVSGQEALVRAILSATIKSGGIAETDPMFRNLYDMVMTAVGADKFLTFTDPSDAQYMYVLLPSLGELNSVQSTATPTTVTSSDADNNYSASSSISIPATPTPESLQMNIVPTSTVGPLSAEQVNNLLWYANNPQPTSTLGPLPANVVNDLVNMALTQQAQQP